MAHEIASVVTCRLCGRTIAGPSLILGPGQSNRVGVFMQSIAGHIAQFHVKEHKLLEQQALEFMGLLMVMQYTTKDEGFKFQRNWLRWRIHQTTLNARFPDEKIEEKSEEFAKSIVELVAADVLNGATAHTQANVAARVKELVTMIRDELQEPVEPKPPASVSVLSQAL
jgi:hypothetical protein